jgi:hypothetical protein
MELLPVAAPQYLRHHPWHHWDCIPSLFAKISPSASFHVSSTGCCLRLQMILLSLE